jgi:hypothetical protein
MTTRAKGVNDDSCNDDNMMEVIVTMTRRGRRLSLQFKNDNRYAMILEDHIYHNRNESTTTEITIENNFMMKRTLL